MPSMDPETCIELLIDSRLMAEGMLDESLSQSDKDRIKKDMEDILSDVDPFLKALSFERSANITREAALRLGPILQFRKEIDAYNAGIRDA